MSEFTKFVFVYHPRFGPRWAQRAVWNGSLTYLSEGAENTRSSTAVMQARDFLLEIQPEPFELAVRLHSWLEEPTAWRKLDQTDDLIGPAISVLFGPAVPGEQRFGDYAPVIDVINVVVNRPASRTVDALRAAWTLYGTTSQQLSQSRVPEPVLASCFQLYHLLANRSVPPELTRQPRQSIGRTLQWMSDKDSAKRWSGQAE